MADDQEREIGEADFWNEYTPPELPPFITKEAKAELVKEGTAFQIEYIRSGDTEFGSRWYVDCRFFEPIETQTSNDGPLVMSETGTFSFNRKGEKSMRDQLLEQMQAYLENHDVISVRLVKQGRAFTFQKA